MCSGYIFGYARSTCAHECARRVCARTETLHLLSLTLSLSRLSRPSRLSISSLSLPPSLPPSVSFSRLLALSLPLSPPPPTFSLAALWISQRQPRYYANANRSSIPIRTYPCTRPQATDMNHRRKNPNISVRINPNIGAACRAARHRPRRRGRRAAASRPRPCAGPAEDIKQD